MNMGLFRASRKSEHPVGIQGLCASRYPIARTLLSLDNRYTKSLTFRDFSDLRTASNPDSKPAVSSQVIQIHAFLEDRDSESSPYTKNDQHSQPFNGTEDVASRLPKARRHQFGKDFTSVVSTKSSHSCSLNEFTYIKPVKKHFSRSISKNQQQQPMLSCKRNSTTSSCRTNSTLQQKTRFDDQSAVMWNQEKRSRVSSTISSDLRSDISLVSIQHAKLSRRQIAIRESVEKIKTRRNLCGSALQIPGRKNNPESRERLSSQAESQRVFSDELFRSHLQLLQDHYEKLRAEYHVLIGHRREMEDKFQKVEDSVRQASETSLVDRGRIKSIEDHQRELTYEINILKNTVIDCQQELDFCFGQSHARASHERTETVGHARATTFRDLVTITDLQRAPRQPSTNNTRRLTFAQKKELNSLKTAISHAQNKLSETKSER